MDEANGTPFGRYRLVELLGRGGMGEVWRAFDTVTNRIVAIKVLPAQPGHNDEFAHRFRREAEAAARLDSPHVVPIYDYGEIEGRLFVCMRLIEGRDLHSVLGQGPLEPARAVRIIEQVAKALNAAHKVRLIHRDVKPQNILLDDDDFAYLIDFGIARAADETRLTKYGNAIGTFAYIAPERLGTGVEEDARADIYSLACVLYECLTGEPPFAGDTMARLAWAHVNTPPPRPSTARPKVPAQFDEVIAKGMAKHPDNRYATTVELADAARAAITVPIQRTPPSPAFEPTVPARPDPEPVLDPEFILAELRKSNVYRGIDAPDINQQRRAEAKRKLERQLERQLKGARARQILVIGGASIVVVAAIAAVVIAIVNTKHEHKSNTAATPEISAPSSSAETTTTASSSVENSRSVAGAGSAVAAVPAIGQPGRQLPVPGVVRPGRQAGQAAADGQDPDQSGRGEREHGNQSGLHRPGAGEQRIALHGEQFRQPDRPEILQQHQMPPADHFAGPGRLAMRRPQGRRHRRSGLRVRQRISNRPIPAERPEGTTARRLSAWHAGHGQQRAAK
jgi:serine/threonine protein kinase